MDDMKQIVLVRSDGTDGDETGREWTVHYILYEMRDEGRTCYDIYDDDGEGNGVQICRGYNLSRMLLLTLRLGVFIEWGKNQPVNR